MATRRRASNDRRETCPVCGRETSHDVRLEIRTESPDPEKAAYSREPYRISTCMECGSETTQRMSDV